MQKVQPKRVSKSQIKGEIKEKKREGHNAKINFGFYMPVLSERKFNCNLNQRRTRLAYNNVLTLSGQIVNRETARVASV